MNKSILTFLNIQMNIARQRMFTFIIYINYSYRYVSCLKSFEHIAIYNSISILVHKIQIAIQMSDR